MSKKELSRELYRKLKLGITTQLLLIPIVIGLIVGLGAIVLHYLIGSLEHWVQNNFLVDGTMPKTIFFIVPAIGGLLSGIIVYALGPDAEGHGTDALIDRFHNKNWESRYRGGGGGSRGPGLT